MGNFGLRLVFLNRNAEGVGTPLLGKHGMLAISSDNLLTGGLGSGTLFTIGLALLFQFIEFCQFLCADLDILNPGIRAGLG